MIPHGFVQELLTRVDIVEVVGRHVELKRGGANFMGLCPFHGEKSPSFSVSPSKQFYYCFGCGAGGDAIRFLTEHLGLSFVEAVRDLAQGVAMTVPEEQVSDDERQRRDTLRQRRLSLGQVLQRAADFYRGQLRGHPQAVAYLKGRGVSGAIAARFGIGYAPPGWKTLAGVFERYDDPLLEEAGLVRQREPDPATDDAAPRDGEADERGRWDWFRDRVMFPIRAVDGSVIGFGGRVLGDGKPKYINSPETPVFSKGRELYGLFEARQALRDKGCALVVEGYMDVVALAQAGCANAVATLGTACTADHVQKLFRHTDAVVFAFDGDAAGRRAAARALEAALPHATDLRTVRFLFLPPEHDPDSYVREHGAPAFEQLIAQAVPLSRQLVEQAGADCDLTTAEGRARMLAQARPLWQALPDGSLRDQLLRDLARTAEVEVDDLRRRWGLDGSGPTPRPRWQQPAPRPLTRPRVAARLPQDQVARILLQRCGWWQELTPADHDALIAVAGWHADLFRWIERWLAEHGDASWTELRQGLQGEPWAEEACALVDGAEVPVDPLREDLLAAVEQTRRAGDLKQAMQVLGWR